MHSIDRAHARVRLQFENILERLSTNVNLYLCKYLWPILSLSQEDAFGADTSPKLISRVNRNDIGPSEYNECFTEVSQLIYENRLTIETDIVGAQDLAANEGGGRGDRGTIFWLRNEDSGSAGIGQ
jgi:hypothetical protein